MGPGTAKEGRLVFACCRAKSGWEYLLPSLLFIFVLPCFIYYKFVLFKCKICVFFLFV